MLKIKARRTCRGKFKELRLLTVAGLYIYECLLFLFKNRDRFTHSEPKHSIPTRYVGLNFPIHRLVATERGPTYSCIKFFNKLPVRIKLQQNFNIFRTEIKSILLDLEPYSVYEFLNHTF
uniref:Uncharacterized protein LOC114347744 n=1 Tax=Diabrotica virgifera virgifera TaxID=50390 RepID=A0A6P7H986_DIAVI